MGKREDIIQSFHFSIVFFRMSKLYFQCDVSCKLPKGCISNLSFVWRPKSVCIYTLMYRAVLQKLCVMVSIELTGMPWYSLYVCCFPVRVWEIEFSKEHDEPDARQRGWTFWGEGAVVSPLYCRHRLLAWTVSIHLANSVVGARGSHYRLLGRNYIIHPHRNSLFYSVQFLLYAGLNLGPDTC